MKQIMDEKNQHISAAYKLSSKGDLVIKSKKIT